jgi:outer membrane receptor protein involved in Fe transport
VLETLPVFPELALPNRTVFFVSDGTGITAETFGNSILSQFAIKPRHLRRPFIDTPDKAHQVVREINHTAEVENRKPIVFVTLVNPDRGLYGPNQTKPFLTHLDDISLTFEDRLKVTPTFALVGGVRIEEIDLSRLAFTKEGVFRSFDGYPVEKTFKPVTGRIGYTWEAIPGLTFYSQYATAADVPASNLFLIAASQPLDLTTARTHETGVKHLLWNGRAEWSFSAYDIERRMSTLPRPAKPSTSPRSRIRATLRSSRPRESPT